MNFTEKMEELKKSISEMITSETPTNQVEKIGNIVKDLDELGDSHKQTLDELGKMKDLYIGAVKNYGTTKPTEDDTPKEVSLEEIGRQIISKRGK